MLSRTRSNVATSKSMLNAVHCFFDSLAFCGLLLKLFVNAGFELAHFINHKVLDCIFDLILEKVQLCFELSFPHCLSHCLRGNESDHLLWVPFKVKGVLGGSH